eukprot:771742-Prymnesium_polylepis.1
MVACDYRPTFSNFCERVYCMWLVCEGNEAPAPPARPERSVPLRSGTERKPNLGGDVTSEGIDGS